MKANRRSFLINAGKLSALTVLQPSIFYANSQESLSKIIERKYKGKSLTLLYPNGSLANIKPVADNFHKRTGVTVILKETSLNDITSELMLKSALSTKQDSIDIALPATFNIPNLAESNAIIKLDEFAEKYESQESSKSSLYKLGDRYLGSLYGYQTDGDAYLLFINQRFYSEANKKRYQDKFGVKLETPKTWQELDRQMKFFHNPATGKLGGTLFRNKDYLVWEFLVRLHAKGLYPFDNQFISRLNSPEAIQALRDLANASASLSPKHKEDGLFENFKSFADGNSFCNLGWGGNQKYLVHSNPELSNDISHDLLPGSLFNKSIIQFPYFNWGWNYVVSSSTKNPELSYLFCLFATSPESSTISVREPEGFFDPFKEEHYEDAGIIKTYGKSFLEAQKKSLIQSMPDLYIRGISQYMALIKEAVYVADRNFLRPEIALKKAHESIEKITDKLGRDKQIQQWEFIRRSYHPLHKSVLK